MTPGFEHILVPLDGTPTSELAIIAAQKAAGDAATLTLVQIAEDIVAPHQLPDGSDMEGFWQKQAQPVRDYLAHAKKLVTREDLHVKTMVATGHPAEAILDIITDAGADAVAMTSHSRSLVYQILIGSTVQTVMARCAVPLIVVHPAES